MTCNAIQRLIELQITFEFKQWILYVGFFADGVAAAAHRSGLRSDGSRCHKHDRNVRQHARKDAIHLEDDEDGRRWVSRKDITLLCLGMRTESPQL